MFTLLLKQLISFFTADKIGILIRSLLIRSGTNAAKEILNIENQKKAYEFVKELHNKTDLTNNEKAKEFNIKMIEWMKKVGKIFTESTINCLRELAVSSLKAEIEGQKNNEKNSI